MKNAQSNCLCAFLALYSILFAPHSIFLTGEYIEKPSEFLYNLIKNDVQLYELWKVGNVFLSSSCLLLYTIQYPYHKQLIIDIYQTIFTIENESILLYRKDY